MTTAYRPDVGVIPEWTLGWRLQRALAHAGVSVEDMATELGVTRATLSRWMHDRGAPPRAAYVKQWALVCGVPATWLLNGTTPGSDRGVITRPNRRRYQATETTSPQVIALRRRAHAATAVRRAARSRTGAFGGAA